MSVIIGWAEESIVPTKNVSLAGQFYERISEYVESDITVTALAIESNCDQAILASVDVEGMTENQINMAREKLSHLLPEFDTRKLVVAVTHTHTSLSLGKREKSDSQNRSSLDVLEEFLPENKKTNKNLLIDETVITPDEGIELVTDKIALAAKKAWEKREEALYANEFGRAPVGMCRRVCYDDGSAQMWGDTNTANFVAFEGGNDSGIELIYTFDKAKILTGIVANIACPAQILEQRSFISADYWGRTKAILREKFGDGIYLLGLCGAAGDQCPRDLVRWVDPETPIKDPNVKRKNVIKHKADPSMYDISGCNKVGRRIANEIISVFEEITDLKDEAVFEHKVIDFDLPLRKVTIEEYNNALREIEYYIVKNKDRDEFTFEDNARMHVYAGIALRYKEQQLREVVSVECHIIRFGNIAVATSPYEMYLDYGNIIKARSMAEQTFIVQLCSGAHGYLPTEKAEKGGHYSAYVSSGDTGHEGGDILVRNTINEINKMF